MKKESSSPKLVFSLVREGEPRATIVLGRNASCSAAYAAAELQRHIHKITGAVLPVRLDRAPAAGGTAIFVGESAATRKLGFHGSDFASQEHEIACRTGKIILIGRDAKSAAGDVAAFPARAPGKFGPGCVFDGQRSVISVPDVRFDDDVGTMEAWVEVPPKSDPCTSPLHSGTIMRIEGGTPKWTYHIINYANGIDPEGRYRSHFDYWSHDGARTCIIRSQELTEGWHHVMGTHDVAARTMKLFVDGVEHGSGEYQRTACWGEVLGIGGAAQLGGASAGNSFLGSIDEVRISSTVRAAGLPKTAFKSDAHTELLLHFNEEAAFVIDDASGMVIAPLPGVWEDRGTLDATYEFLERCCDVRWYAPTDIGTTHPVRSTLEVRGVNVRRSPAMRMRTVALGINPWFLASADRRMSDRERHAWMLRFRMGGDRRIFGHSLPGRYADKHYPILSACELFDPASGTWSATGRLTISRAGHTATLLSGSEQVLVVGGSRQTELYDPKTGGWSKTGKMKDTWNAHTATLLGASDGNRVIVAGCFIPESLHTEIFDAVSGAWRRAGDMNQAHWQHTATRLDTGRVLIVGGLAQRGAELLDPTTEAWSLTGFMREARRQHTAVMLSDGTVLVAGGVGLGEVCLRTCERYQPATGQWIQAGPLSQTRAGHTATLLQDGRVLVVGGRDASFRALDSAEIYDSSTDSWAPAGTLSAARSGHTATRLTDGNVLIAGGYCADGAGAGRTLASAEMYDCLAGTWHTVAALTAARDSHTATLLPDGRVLIAGGYGDDGTEVDRRTRFARDRHGNPILAIRDDDEQLTPTQMCYSNAHVVAEVAKDAIGFFNGQPPISVNHGDHTFSLAPADNASWCQCPDCTREMNEAENSGMFSNGRASYTIYNFTNKVAREVARVHPDGQARLGQYAYADYTYHPRSREGIELDVEPNVIVVPCLGVRNWWCPPVEANDRRVLKEWREREPDTQLFVYLYYLFPAANAFSGKFHCFPGFMAHTVVKQMELYAEHGVSGFYIENSAHCEHSYLFDQLELYLTFKLADDPGLEGEALIDEFFDRYYGVAARPMRALYCLIEETFSTPSNYPPEVQYSKTDEHQTAQLAWGVLGTPERMAECAKLMAVARRRATVGVVRERVEAFREGVWDYMVKGHAEFYGSAK